jgi:hypothetical protein
MQIYWMCVNCKHKMNMYNFVEYNIYILYTYIYIRLPLGFTIVANLYIYTCVNTKWNIQSTNIFKKIVYTHLKHTKK